jgi:PmbA protein
MEYNTFKDTLFARAKEYGFSDYELYYTASDSFEVETFGGEISKYVNTNEMGISFRGTYNGRIGYAYTEKMDGNVINLLIKNAAGNAGIIEEKEIEKLYPGDKSYPKAKGYNPALKDVTAAKKIETALAMEKHAMSLDERVKSVDFNKLGTGERTIRIANAYGLDLSYQENIFMAGIFARAEENGVTKTGFDIWVGNDFNPFDYKELAGSAVKKALDALGATSVASGEYPILFDNKTATDLFSVFANVFFAENAQKGFSLLHDKVGEKIAAPCVTLRDDGFYDGYFMSVPFDSEGVATQNKAVIENGTLMTLLYNTKSAEKGGVKSTGNGFKPSFRASVGTSVTNFYLVPSDKTHDDLIKETGSGILITHLAGLHSGANTVSGDFSLSADGFMIENGKIAHPIEQITVAGNFYDMLKGIAAVGSDLRFGFPGSGGAIGMPSFLVKGLRISGL